MIRCPSDLGKHGKKIWKALQSEYQIEDTAGLLLLKRIAECEDKIQKWADILNQEGLMKGNRGHPANSYILRYGRMQKDALKMLNLDIVESGPIGRPPN